MSKQDEIEAAAARLRTTERELKLARLDALEARVMSASHTELIEMCGQFEVTERLDAENGDLLTTDEAFARGFALGEVRGMRVQFDSEHEQHRLDSIRVVRDRLNANRAAGLPGSRHDTADAIRERLAAIDLKKRN